MHANTDCPCLSVAFQPEAAAILVAIGLLACGGALAMFERHDLIAA
jgi:hypothetical protein